MVAILKTDSRVRHGLIALLAIRRARAIRDRKAREAAEREARPDTPPRKRGWFR